MSAKTKAEGRMYQSTRRTLVPALGIAVAEPDDVAISLIVDHLPTASGQIDSSGEFGRSSGVVGDAPLHASCLVPSFKDGE
jgi:hypothetical protein